MKTDSEVKYEGMLILLKYMDNLDAERFITLIKREEFDYTQWRQKLFIGMTGREISKLAMQYQEKLQ
jgi:hypothetical protein